jgi:type II secretory pathway pseudopilin PulG
MRYREKNRWFLFHARSDEGCARAQCRRARPENRDIGPCGTGSRMREPGGGPPRSGAPGLTTNCGYTLLEVLISLFLFIAIAVPMLTGVVTNTGALRSQEALTAAYILEQEAAFARLFPDDVPLVKHRVVDGKSWTVTIDAQGSPLRKFELVAMHNGKKCGMVVVYGMMGEK